MVIDWNNENFELSFIQVYFKFLLLPFSIMSLRAQNK